MEFMTEAKDTSTSKGLKETVDRFHEPKEMRAVFDENNLKIQVELVKSHQDAGKFGGNHTFIAFKNPSSYAVVTSMKGLKVVEEASQIYSEALPGIRPATIKDLTYVDHLDCYLLIYNYKIFRKDLTESAPYPFLDFFCGFRLGGSFRYSKKNKKLIIAKTGFEIAVVNLERKIIEFGVKSANRMKITDFKLFGRKEEKIVSVDNSGLICLYSISYDLKKICAKHSHQLDLIEGRTEEGLSLGVCDQSRYVMVSLIDYTTYKSSRLFVFEVKGPLLTKLATLDEHASMLNPKYSLEFFRSVGEHLLWVGVSVNNGFVFVYDFDRESGELKELVEKRAVHQEECPWKIQRFANQFYYIGKKASLMRFGLTL